MKRFVMASVASLACCLALAGCSTTVGQGSSISDANSAASAESVKPVDDAVAIDQLDWTVQEEIIDGNRRVGFSYTNNSDYPIVSFDIKFTQRADVTDEQRSVFDSMYADDSAYIPPVDASELYADAENQHYAAPGDEVDPWTCELSYSLTSLSMEQYELMEPNIAHIRYIGDDGNIYSEYYDFLNDRYELDKGETEETVASDTWPESDLAKMMPKMDAAAITVENDDDESFKVLAYGVTEDDFTSYVDQCKEAGFDQVDDENSMSCTLRNADGYSIDITYYQAYDYFYSELTPPEE